MAMGFVYFTIGGDGINGRGASHIIVFSLSSYLIRMIL